MLTNPPGPTRAVDRLSPGVLLSLAFGAGVLVTVVLFTLLAAALSALGPWLASRCGL